MTQKKAKLKSIQHIINNEFDTGNVSIATAIEAVKIAYQEIIDMIESNFETIGELGGGTTDAQSIINRINDVKDSLRRDGQITEKQAQNWSQPNNLKFRTHRELKKPKTYFN